MAAAMTPTKGNLMAVKRMLSLAHLGYDLMDRKRNILIREMMGMIDRAAEIQSRIDKTFVDAYASLQIANITLGICSDLAGSVKLDDSVNVRYHSVMGVEIPLVTAGDRHPDPDFGFAFTNKDLDTAVVSFVEVKKLVAELAEVETSVYRLAGAIRKTQKRANALQNIIIPNYTKTVKFITEALEEKEREEFVRLKVLKKRGS